MLWYAAPCCWKGKSHQSGLFILNAPDRKWSLCAVSGFKRPQYKTGKESIRSHCTTQTLLTSSAPFLSFLFCRVTSVMRESHRWFTSHFEISCIFGDIYCFLKMFFYLMLMKIDTFRKKFAWNINLFIREHIRISIILSQWNTFMWYHTAYWAINDQVPWCMMKNYTSLHHTWTGES